MEAEMDERAGLRAERFDQQGVRKGDWGDFWLADFG